MLVYDKRARRGSLAHHMHEIATAARGLERHAGPERQVQLVGLLIACGELAQGIADAAFARRGVDEPGAAERAAMRLTLAVARALWRSHAGAKPDTRPIPLDALEALARMRLPAWIEIRDAEGFKYYAVYPESYGAAARAVTSPDRGAPIVIGLRSIGVPLAAMVAVAGGSHGLPFTLRPVGPPFARRPALGPRLLRRVRAAAGGRRFAIVDEGPGASGSSFGGTADLLCSLGVAEQDLCFFPSHANPPGPAARDAHRARWSQVRRAFVPFEELWPSWTAFLEPILGRLDGPALDFGAGRWRAHVFADRAQWPAVRVELERRKYLLHAGGQRWLARFAGIARYGDAVRARAEALAAAGFSPPVAGMAHGFLVQPWLDDARPLADLGADPRERREIVARVADYLAFRAYGLPAQGGTAGASPARLLQMASLNAREAFGERFADRLNAFEAWVPHVERAAHPVPVDGRMHRWEWLRTGAGRLLKVDAVDHCDGHDLVGCQDPAWDVAGAGVELALSDSERDQVARRLGGGRSWPLEVLAFYEVCYLAFQVGLHALGATWARQSDPEEAARLDRAVMRYGRQLDLRTSPARLARVTQCTA